MKTYDLSGSVSKLFYDWNYYSSTTLVNINANGGISNEFKIEMSYDKSTTGGPIEFSSVAMFAKPTEG